MEDVLWYDNIPRWQFTMKSNRIDLNVNIKNDETRDTEKIEDGDFRA